MRGVPSQGSSGLALLFAGLGLLACWPAKSKIVCLQMLNKKVDVSVSWPWKLEAGAKNRAGRVRLMVGAVKRFCSLAKQRMGAWLGEDHGGCGASARDLVNDVCLQASAGC